MGQFRVVAASLLLCAIGASTAFAQGEVPRVIPFSGVADGSSPISKPIPISFAIYEGPSGGAALFIETQTVALQPGRQFQVLLGAATPGGVPASIFVSNQALFVGVQVVGQPEQPRVMFASVPYALKAADADSLGGLPASDYVTDAEASAGNAYTDAQVAAEAAARAAADTVLQGNIDAEAAARAAADFTLQNNIDAEAAARAAGDTVLQGNIDAEAAARAAADFTLQNNIDAEAAARAAGDTVLQGNIDAEAAARAAADFTLQSNINAETAARAAADTVLQGNIDAEAAVRAAADNVLQNQVDAVATSAINSLSGGTGISISGSGNSRTITNTGDTNAGDDITTLVGGTGISISGSGGTRTIANTGDTNALDDITTLSGSGGVTISGSGNSRTVGHSTWFCAAGSSIRSIDSAGNVACEFDDAAIGGGGSGVQRSINLPLGSFMNVELPAAIDFAVGSNTTPDFAIVDGMLAIQYHPGPAGHENIATTFAIPPDYVSGGTVAVRLSKDSHTGADEFFGCVLVLNSSLVVAVSQITTTSAASTLYTGSIIPSLAIGDAITLKCTALGIPTDNTVNIHSIEFRYTGQ